MPQRKKLATKKSLRRWAVDWRLVAYFVVGAVLSPVAYFGATTLAATTGPQPSSSFYAATVVKPGCPFVGWGQGSCTVSSFTMTKGKHYTFSGLSEVSATSPLADIGWVAQTGGNFFNRYGTDALPMAYSVTPQDDYSFASTWDGGTGDIASVTCPDFSLVQVNGSGLPRFTYLEGTRNLNGTIDWNTSSYSNIAVGNVYCVVNHDNTQIVKMKVLSLSSSSINVQLQYVKGTGVKTYGCADGYCNTSVHDYCVGCSGRDPQIMTTDFNVRTTVKQCVDAKLKPSIARPTIRQFYPDQMGGTGSESGTTYSEGLAARSYGFEGIINPGDTKVTLPSNVYISQHEMTHQYNHVFISDGIKRWLDEGLAIAFAKHVGHACDPKTFSDDYRDVSYASVKSGQVDPAGLESHRLGSVFFEGLSTDYGCGGTCIYKVFQSLQSAYKGYNGSTPPTMTVAGIRTAIKNGTGVDVQPLMTLLKITDSTP